MNEKSVINNEYDYSNIIPLIDYITYLVRYCDDTLKQLKRLFAEDEERNKALKYEYKDYTFKACYGDRCEVYISGKDYNGIITCKDLESFNSAVSNGNLNNISKLKIVLDLDYERGSKGNMEKHENSFSIIFEPYNIKFKRSSNFKDDMMDMVENDINNMLRKFPVMNTIFCTKVNSINE